MEKGKKKLVAMACIAIAAVAVCAVMALVSAGGGQKGGGDVEYRTAMPEQGAVWAIYYEDGTGTYTLDTTGREGEQPAVLKAGVKLAVCEPDGKSSTLAADETVEASLDKSDVPDNQQLQAGDTLVIANSDDGRVASAMAIKVASAEDAGDCWKVTGSEVGDEEAYEVAPEIDRARTDIDEVFMSSADNGDDDGESNSDD